MIVAEILSEILPLWYHFFLYAPLSVLSSDRCEPNLLSSRSRFWSTLDSSSIFWRWKSSIAGLVIILNIRIAVDFWVREGGRNLHNSS